MSRKKEAMTRRKGVIAVCVALALVTSATPSIASGPQTDGSFRVTAFPYADVMYVSPVGRYYTCLDGVEGVHKVTHRVESPRAGMLTATLSDFTGDWDIALLDEEGQLLARSWTDAGALNKKGKETVRVWVERGEVVDIAACNWLSTDTDALVEYRVARGDGYRAWRASRDLKNLGPESLAGLREHVPVNIVFVGYKKSQIDLARFRKLLPRRSRPLVRSKLNYGEQDFLGIDYTYDYRFTFTSRGYEDRFFSLLKRLGGRGGSPSSYQRLYNQQEKKVLEITSNSKIDAPKVERWLGDNPPPGVNTSRNTLFLINWYGRKDFRHHVYVKSGHKDPDSGYDWSTDPYSWTSAWGGSAHDDPETGTGRIRRVWFHDLSAGPDWASRNWIVDRKDLNGNGWENYRMPPAWEYARNGYRKPGALTGDLAKIARYVAIDMLFTPSPLYPPALTPPDLPRSIHLNLNTYEATRGSTPSQDWIKPKEIRRQVARLLPLKRVTVDGKVLPVADEEFATCYAHWYWVWGGQSCYPDKPYTNWADLFLVHALKLDDIRDTREADYEAVAINYAINDMGWVGGYADWNYWDGTQSMIHSAMISRAACCWGFTSIATHEYGHHFGLSHPHDGFDYERHIEFGPYNDAFYFSMLGTAVNSVMGYLFATNNFSQFDRDNMNRWQAAAYLNAANEILDRIGERRSARINDHLEKADAFAGAARRAFAAHTYLSSARFARRAYDAMRAAAKAARVEIEGDLTGLTVRHQDEDDEARGRGMPLHRGAIDDFSELPLFEKLGDPVEGRPHVPAGLEGGR